MKPDCKAFYLSPPGNATESQLKTGGLLIFNVLTIQKNKYLCMPSLQNSLGNMQSMENDIQNSILIISLRGVLKIRAHNRTKTIKLAWCSRTLVTMRAKSDSLLILVLETICENACDIGSNSLFSSECFCSQ